MTSLVDVSQDSEIARQVMAEVLGLDVEDCSADSRGAQMIREGIKRYRLTAERVKDAEIERLREALEPFARQVTDGTIDADERDTALTWEHPVGMDLSIADFRRAADVLNRERDNATG